MMAAGRRSSMKLPDTGKRIAVVGAGPAGLTAAFYLRKRGHAVTVLEANPEPGGQLRYGIPTYRLPIDVLNRDIDIIQGSGIELQCDRRVRSLDELADYDAVLVAHWDAQRNTAAARRETICPGSSSMSIFERQYA
jgi:formate dehydrogenase beta subunit